MGSLEARSTQAGTIRWGFCGGDAGRSVGGGGLGFVFCSFLLWVFGTGLLIFPSCSFLFLPVILSGVSGHIPYLFLISFQGPLISISFSYFFLSSFSPDLAFCPPIIIILFLVFFAFLSFLLPVEG